MTRTSWLLILLGALVLAAAGDLLWHYPRLPEQVATKFDAGGAVKASSPKATFLAGQILLNLFLVGIALAGRFLLPRFPAHLINVPNRAYWLAPERADVTRHRIGELVLALCIAQFAFLNVLTHLTLRANLTGSPALGREPWWWVGAFFAVVGVVLVRSMLAFRLPR